MADELVVIVPNDRKWANRKIITPTEFCSDATIFAEEGSSTRRVVLQHLSKHDLVSNIALELGHTEAVKRAVEVGLGVSIISKHAIKAEIDTNRLKSLPLEGIDRSTTIRITHQRQLEMPTQGVL